MTNDLPHLGHYIQSRHMYPVRVNMPHLGTIPKFKIHVPSKGKYTPFRTLYPTLRHMHPVRANIPNQVETNENCDTR